MFSLFSKTEKVLNRYFPNGRKLFSKFETQNLLNNQKVLLSISQMICSQSPFDPKLDRKLEALLV
jgi:hypothetical protein